MRRGVLLMEKTLWWFMFKSCILFPHIHFFFSWYTRCGQETRILKQTFPWQCCCTAPAAVRSQDRIPAEAMQTKPTNRNSAPHCVSPKRSGTFMLLKMIPLNIFIFNLCFSNPFSSCSVLFRVVQIRHHSFIHPPCIYPPSPSNRPLRAPPSPPQLLSRQPSSSPPSSRPAKPTSTGSTRRPAPQTPSRSITTTSSISPGIPTFQPRLSRSGARGMISTTPVGLLFSFLTIDS